MQYKNWAELYARYVMCIVTTVNGTYAFDM
jgi:hypothetical protein